MYEQQDTCHGAFDGSPRLQSRAYTGNGTDRTSGIQIDHWVNTFTSTSPHPISPANITSTTAYTGNIPQRFLILSLNIRKVPSSRLSELWEVNLMVVAGPSLYCPEARVQFPSLFWTRGGFIIQHLHIHTLYKRNVCYVYTVAKYGRFGQFCKKMDFFMWIYIDYKSVIGCYTLH